ncbi:MAG: VWA domain-containing protein [Phycisphaerae bacterium]|jgi:hypothetical protein
MEPLQFANPALLTALGLAGLPLIVHLLLRPRPRRVIFPALHLARQSLTAARRRRRLQDVGLLLLRMLILACAALLLAAPSCGPRIAPTDTPGQPTACVFVIDDSCSATGRQADGASLQAALIAEADRRIDAAERLTPPPALGLVWADPNRQGAALADERATLRRELHRSPAPRHHATPLGHALRRAATMLSAIEPARRRIVLLTDGAAHAWRDVSAAELSQLGPDALEVLAPDLGPRTNLAILDARGPDWPISEAAPIPLELTVRSAALAASGGLSVYSSAGLVARSQPTELPADRDQTVSLVAPPMPLGEQGLCVVLEPADGLDFDQLRYLALRVERPPLVWIIANEPPPGGDIGPAIVRTLLAPAALPPERQLVRVESYGPRSLRSLASPHADTGSGAPKPDDAEAPRLIVLFSGCELNEAARRKLGQFVEHGAALVLAPVLDDAVVDWPGVRAWLARSPGRAETMSAAATTRWQTGSRFHGRGEEMDEWQRCAVRARVLFDELERGTSVEAAFPDGAPMLLSVRRGRGAAYLLGASLDPRFSDLGIRAAALLTWMHALLGGADDPTRGRADFLVGEALDAARATGAASILRQFDYATRSWRDRALRPPHASPQEPGLVIGGASPAGVQRELLAVNWPPEESDLTEISDARLREITGNQDVSLRRIGHAAEDARRRAGSWFSAGVDAAQILGLFLLVALFVEPTIANRTPRSLKRTG